MYTATLQSTASVSHTIAITAVSVSHIYISHGDIKIAINKQ